MKKRVRVPLASVVLPDSPEYSFRGSSPAVSLVRAREAIVPFACEVEKSQTDTYPVSVLSHPGGAIIE